MRARTATSPAPRLRSSLSPGRARFLRLLARLGVRSLETFLARSPRDDYPHRRAVSKTASDRWGFTQRQCVSFVAWRLHQIGRPIHHSSSTPWGSAHAWEATARAARWQVSASPALGAVAHWRAGEASSYYEPGSKSPSGTLTAGADGHVGFVIGTYPDGSAHVEQYNQAGSRAYSRIRVRAPRYLLS